jgi:hypothetical protein
LMRWRAEDQKGHSTVRQDIVRRGVQLWACSSDRALGIVQVIGPWKNISLLTANQGSQGRPPTDI